MIIKLKNAPEPAPDSDAAEATQQSELAGLLRDLDRFAAALPPLDDSAPLIRRDRER